MVYHMAYLKFFYTYTLHGGKLPPCHWNSYLTKRYVYINSPNAAVKASSHRKTMILQDVSPSGNMFRISYGQSQMCVILKTHIPKYDKSCVLPFCGIRLQEEEGLRDNKF